MGHSGDDVAGACFAFRSNHRCTFPDAAHSFAQSGSAADKRDAVVVLVDVEIRISGRENLLSSTMSTPMDSRMRASPSCPILDLAMTGMDVQSRIP